MKYLSSIFICMFLYLSSIQASKFVELKVLDNGFIMLHFKDGDVVFVDDGKGPDAFGSHGNDANNNYVVSYGEPLNVSNAVTAANWQLKSIDDSNYGSTGLSPNNVYRKSKLNGHGQFEWAGSDFRYEYTHKHYLFLELPHGLQSGNEYTLSIKPEVNSDSLNISFTYDNFHNVSEAIHHNLVGFLSSNSVKAVDLYMWMGDGGARDYSSFVGNNVYLYDVVKQDTHLVSTVSLWKNKATDLQNRYLIQSDVWKADFTGFNTPGTYRVVVEGIGSSNDFEIKPLVYKEPFEVSVKGFFYMRIGQDSVNTRPVPRRPLYIPGKDGVVVYKTNIHPYHPDWPGGGDRWDQPNFFANYVQEGKPINPNVFGGHSDALDWDRHLGHVSIIYDMLLPYILSKGALNDDDLGIAESGNGIPDLLDEAQYEVDFWLRLRDGLGYSHGLSNPNESKELYQAAATPMAAWANAANAAMMAEAYRIAGIDSLMEYYKDESLKAYHYASNLKEQMLDHTQSVGEATFRGRDFKMLAAAYLYNVTGYSEFEDVVNQESLATSATSSLMNHNAYNQLWSTAAYLLTNRIVNYPVLYKNMKASIIHRAKEIEANNSKNWPSRRATDYNTGYFQTIQNVHRTMVAHAVTDNNADKSFFEDAMILEAGWGLGRNPLNIIQMTTATTSLESKRSVVNIYTSGRDDGSPGLHPGHTPYLNIDDWFCGMNMGCPSKLYGQNYPTDVSLWPFAEHYYNSRYTWAHSEFTPQQTMRGKMALYGYLYALGKKLDNPPSEEKAHVSTNPFDEFYSFSGRTDTSMNEGPIMYYAGSYMKVRFEGNQVSAILADIKSKKKSKVGFIIDNKDTIVVELSANTVDTFLLANNLGDGIHDLVMYKMEDPGAGIFGLQFRGLILENGKGILPVEQDYALKIEYFGDSFVAGVGSGCANDGDCGSNNGYNSFANIAGRILNAEVYNNGIGGLAVMNNTGWYQTQTTGLQTTYNKLNPSNEVGNNYTNWDFSRYNPDVVVFGFGINDSYGANPPFDTPETWIEAYKSVIKSVIDEYGKDSTTIVLAPGNIWNDAYTHAPQIVSELKSEGYNAYYFQFSFDLDAHPTKSEHELMGKELADFIFNVNVAPVYQYELKVSIENGQVSLNPAGGIYDSGTEVSLTATGDEKYVFSGWSGDMVSTENPITVVMDKNMNLEAGFTYVSASNINKVATKHFLHPNPVNSIIYLNVDTDKTLFYEISDISGKVILKGQLGHTNNNIDVSSLKNGLYLFNAKGISLNWSSKFLKE